MFYIFWHFYSNSILVYCHCIYNAFLLLCTGLVVSLWLCVWLNPSMVSIHLKLRTKFPNKIGCGIDFLLIASDPSQLYMWLENIAFVFAWIAWKRIAVNRDCDKNSLSFTSARLMYFTHVMLRDTENSIQGNEYAIKYFILFMKEISQFTVCGGDQT